MADLENTGERLHAELIDVNAVEHLHRYSFACSLVTGLTVLDIASGEGYGTNLLAAHAARVIGVDISAQAIAHAQGKYQRHNLEYRLGSTDAIPLGALSVDCVISFETLEHHDRHEEMFAEIKRVLKPEGFLVISTPDKLNYTDKSKQQNHFHVKELYAAEFKALIGRHFGNSSYYGQRAGFFGLLIPEESESLPFSHYSGDFNTSVCGSVMPEPIYSVAIASDSRLPAKIYSAFSAASVYEDLRKFSTAQTEKLLQAESRLANASTELANLKRSTSYLLGRTITWPLRLFRF